MRQRREGFSTAGRLALVAAALVTSLGVRPFEEVAPLNSTTSHHAHAGLVPFYKTRKHVFVTLYDANFKDAIKSKEVAVLDKTGGTEIGTLAVKKVILHKKPGYITLKIDTTLIPTPKPVPCDDDPIGPLKAGPGTGTVLIITVTTKTSEGTNTSTTAPDAPLNVETTDEDPCSDFD